MGEIARSYTIQYLNKEVEVEIDRPLGSRHPKHGFVYEVNYGFISNTKAPDGEEIDAYVLGIQEALHRFKGVCIAVIHRLDDNDDKLVVALKGMNFTEEEIRQKTFFQEKHFKSEILRPFHESL